MGKRYGGMRIFMRCCLKKSWAAEWQHFNIRRKVASAYISSTVNVNKGGNGRSVFLHICNNISVSDKPNSLAVFLCLRPTDGLHSQQKSISWIDQDPSNRYKYAQKLCAGRLFPCFSRLYATISRLLTEQINWFLVADMVHWWSIYTLKNNLMSLPRTM
jgi:hypothetical protein